MPVKKKTPKKAKRAANSALRQLDEMRRSVRVLKLKLERETRARKIEARIKSEAEKVGARLTTQLKALRDQGRKLASELKSAVTDASRREAARKEALARIAALRTQYAKTSAGLRAELSHKTAELRRKSEELIELAGQSAHRAAEIIRGEEHHAPADEVSLPEPPAEGAPRKMEDRKDDEGPDQEHH